MFRRVGGTWTEEQKIIDPNTDDLDQFGYSVSVSGNTFVAGVYKYDYGSNTGAGAAFVYKWNETSWVKEAELYSPNADISYGFGNSVAIDSNRIIVGEMYYDGNASNSGAAFLFERNSSSWSQGQKLEDPSGAPNDYFGRSVAIDGDTVPTGAYKEDEDQTDSGAAFVFSVLIGDLNRDSRVNFEDFAILARQWRLEKLTWDTAPDGGNGTVNFMDWAVFAQEWQNTTDMEYLAVFVEQWLQRGAYSADIAPVPNGDGRVDMLDFVVLADNWLQ